MVKPGFILYAVHCRTWSPPPPHLHDLFSLTTIEMMHDDDDPLLRLEEELSASHDDVTTPGKEGCDVTSKLRAVLYHWVAVPVVRARWFVLGAFSTLLSSGVCLQKSADTSFGGTLHQHETWQKVLSVTFSCLCTDVLGGYLVLLAISVGLMLQLRPASKPPQMFDEDTNLQQLLDLAANVSNEKINCELCSGFYKVSEVKVKVMRNS